MELIKLFIVTILTLSFSLSFSQDIIIKKNGDEISAKVTELTDDLIKYKRFENIEGPVYSIQKSEVFMIRYSNGSKETFNVENRKESTIPSGTEIKIKSVEKVVSRNVKDGDEIKFETHENVIVNNIVAIPKGTPIFGQVKDVEKGKALGKEGKLDIIFNYVQLPDGKKIKITSSKNFSGKNNTTGAIVGAVLFSPLWLLTSGSNAKIKEGQIFSVFVE